jgi:type IV secretory pathway VirB2 component (pilin)
MEKINLWILKNQKEIVICICMLVVLSSLVSCEAAGTDAPFKTGFDKITDWLTGYAPAAVGIIALASYCVMYATGHSAGPVAAWVLRLIICISCAAQAATVVGFIGTTSGSLF